MLLMIDHWCHGSEESETTLLSLLFVQSIEKVKVDREDKPFSDVKILNVTLPKP